jgi:hypothetical protein
LCISYVRYSFGHKKIEGIPYRNPHGSATATKNPAASRKLRGWAANLLPGGGSLEPSLRSQVHAA